MIQLNDNDRAQLGELATHISGLFAKLEGAGISEDLRREIGVYACRVQALSDSEKIIHALYTVEDGHTPDPDQIELLRTGLYYADPLKIDEQRIRVALAAGAERRLRG